jgi:hypothetical protein
MVSLNGGVLVSGTKTRWDDSALAFVAELINATRRDLAAVLVVRLALKASPLDGGQQALAALRISRWPADLDVADFVDQHVWPERERVLLAQQVAQEVHQAQAVERQRRAADQASRNAARTAEVDRRLADEEARQDDYRRRFPRSIAK